MYVNGKMRAAEAIPGMREGGWGMMEGNEFNYDIL
jgi:hypothetical protein